MAKIQGGYNIEADLKKRFADYCRSRRVGPIEDIVAAAMLWYLDSDVAVKEAIVAKYTELVGEALPDDAEPSSKTHSQSGSDAAGNTSNPASEVGTV